MLVKAGFTNIKMWQQAANNVIHSGQHYYDKFVSAKIKRMKSIIDISPDVLNNMKRDTI